MEYTVLEIKNKRLSKVKIHINSSETDEISNEKATKIELREPIFSYEAGLILGTSKDSNKIYVQFEDTEEDKCQIFVTGIALSRINETLFNIVQKYGKHVQC